MSGREDTVVLLAAGYGQRISTLTNDPKCLLEIGGVSLLERHFQIWRRLGVKNVHLVLGYKSELVRTVAERHGGNFDLSFSINEDYRRLGNTFSLYLGIRHLSDPCLIFDADLIYESHLLEDFLNDEEENQMLVGQGNLSDIECTKVLVDDFSRVRILADKRAVSEDEHKRYRFVGEAVGVLKFSRDYTQRLAAMGKEFLSQEKNLSVNWEHLINPFVREWEVGVHILSEASGLR